MLGVEPECFDYTSRVQAIKGVTNIVNRLTQKEYVPAKSIVILSNKKFEESILVNEDYIGSFRIDKYKEVNEIEADSIRFSTVSEFKGLESDLIIFINHVSSHEITSKDKKCEQYVALTRARYYLYILNIIT